VKKLLFAVATAAGVLAFRRWQDSEKSKSVWSKATDNVS